MPDGSLLVLLNTGAKNPPAVVLLGSEGATDTVATSLEEFLLLLGNGETGLDDLDKEDATGRAKLCALACQEQGQGAQGTPLRF